MPIKVTALVLTLLTGLALGYLMGTRLPESRTSAVVQSPAEPYPSVAREHNASLLPDATNPSVTEPAVEEQHPDVVNRELRRIDELDSDFEQSIALYRLMEPMDAGALMTLLDTAQNALSGNDLRAAAGIVLGRIAELDADSALDYVQNARSDLRNAWLRNVFHSLARVDEERALALAETLNAQQQRIATAAIVQALDDRSPGIRAEIASRMDAPHISLVNPRRNPAAAWQAVQAEPHSQKKYQQLSGILMLWTQQDPTAAMAATADLSTRNGMREGYQQMVLQTWQQQDPEAAGLWLLSQEESEQSRSLTQSFVQQLAQLDIDAARRFMANLQGQAYADAERAIQPMLALTDPESVARWIEEQPNDESRFEAGILMQLDFTAPEAADRLFNALSPQLRNVYGPSRAGILASRDLDSALRVLESLDDPAAIKQTQSAIVQQLADSDPDRARDFITSQPRAQRPAMYESLSQAWVHQDASAARRFTNTLRGEDFDGAASGLIMSGRLDRDNATDLLRQISDTARRRNAATLLFYRLRQTDPKAAEALRDAEGLDVVALGQAQD